MYKNLNDFKSRVVKLTISDLWQFDVKENLVIATLKSPQHILPNFEIFIHENLLFTVRVYG